LKAVFPIGEKYGVDDGAPALERLSMEIAVESPHPAGDVTAILGLAEKYCHGSQSVRQVVPVTVTASLNGEMVDIANERPGGEQL